MAFVIKDVQVAFLDKALTKQAMKGTTNSPKYSVSILWPDGKTPEGIREGVQAAISKKWTSGSLPEGARKPFRTGEKKSWLPEGSTFINAKSEYMPDVYVEADGNEKITMPNDPRLVSGSYCDVILDAYGYDNAGNRGVGYGLTGILIKNKKFAAISGSRPDTSAMFGFDGTSDSASAPASQEAAPQADDAW